MRIESFIYDKNDDEFAVRCVASWYNGFVSRDRSEPDEASGWIIDEHSLEIQIGDEWQPIADHLVWDDAHDKLQEKANEMGRWDDE